jgi:REP element-mobilizing transposase RayT
MIMMSLFRRVPEAGDSARTKGYHGVEITSPDFFETKLNYIHLNPVRAKIVERAEDYYYSSCADYLGKRKGLLDVEFI